MAKTVSEEEIQLRKRARRRLVGAVTLVIAAIVILPMVLDSKPEQRSHQIDIRIPSEDSVGELAPEATPGTPPAEAQVATIPEGPATGMQEDQSASQPAANAARSVKNPMEKRDAVSGTEGRTPDPKAPKAESTGKTSTSAVDADLFVVQLGAFSNPAKARQQLRSVMSKDIKAQPDAKAYTETLKSDKGDITRVRVGPFRTREEAESTRETLNSLGFEGVVTEKGP
ncbi:SPOR domain-containing protein [Nitrosospira briensis]|uniref:SPOR domain-containing protein n=1 Tax=Nitrosospira briensis TaxID=35799 RepID=UPI0008E2F037|nr:SPOR domain-containing protein [Nitrosospira briensis]SFO20474.1 DedD protein [Nitrosospira briensis]